jgi:hypothetical protein
MKMLHHDQQLFQPPQELRLHGYTVVDNIVSKEVAAQIKVAALAHYRRGG